MLLSIDAGNSTVKVALVKKGEVRRARSVPTDAAVAMFARAIEACCGKNVSALDGAAITSVVPALTDRLSSMAGKIAHCKPLIITHRQRFPFRWGISHPAQVGTDRLCAASGVMTASRKSAVIVDIGSAITVDLVLERRFMGGMIMAGPELTLGALHHHTAQLPKITFNRQVIRPGGMADNTRGALWVGAMTQALGAISAAVKEHEMIAGKKLQTFVTGGGTGPLTGHFPVSWRINPNLVMMGLEILWKLNKA